MTPEEAERYLALWDAASLLEEANPGKRIERVAIAIKRFVRGDAVSLEHALGMTRSEGRPKDPERREIARLVYPYRIKHAPTSWDEIFSKLSASGHLPANCDCDNMRKAFYEYKDSLITEELDARLDGPHWK
jgi:hypothetical protein